MVRYPARLDEMHAAPQVTACGCFKFKYAFVMMTKLQVVEASEVTQRGIIQRNMTHHNALTLADHSFVVCNLSWCLHAQTYLVI